MYLIVNHIPVYVDRGRYYTDISWQKDLILTRDWLANSFGGLKLLSPSLPLESVAPAEVMKLSPIGVDDDIHVAPSVDARLGAPEFWLRQGHQWVGDVQRELRDADVMHTSAACNYYPHGFWANNAAIMAGVPTVFVGPDADPHVRMTTNMQGRLYCIVFDRLMRRALRGSSLALLKEGLVYDRYAKYGKNAKAFCHSMYSKHDILDEALLEKRLGTLGHERPLRAVYAGRFIPLKGLRDSITAISRARRLGVDVEYHIYGSGPQNESLRSLAVELGIRDFVHFHGFVEYSSQFIMELAAYDLLLYMPTEEDTPRMLYDAMAAGLPLVGSRIPFLEHRTTSDHMGILVDIGDSFAAAKELQRLYNEPERLKLLSRAALAGGNRHSSEEWYRQRAEWTQQAVECHKLNRRML